MIFVFTLRFTSHYKLSKDLLKFKNHLRFAQFYLNDNPRFYLEIFKASIVRNLAKIMFYLKFSILGKKSNS